MEFQTLEIDRRGPVLWVWLARPEKRNALNTVALEEIEAVFSALQTDFTTRAVVLAGQGPSFCGGADRTDPPASATLHPDSGASDRERRWAAQIGRRACRAIELCEIPTIARIQGFAVGGGVALALACDFRVATEDAIFHVPEVDLGIPLTWGAAARLIQECGMARAREAILLCDRFDAATAERWGAVHRVVTAENLDDTVQDLATRLASKPEVAVHMTKTQFRGYAEQYQSGTMSEADGDLLVAASRLGVAR
ncbi:MAG: enoyl-CoA hydratase/carnithine racemase, partial [Hyphomicrobiaceae bacterium]